MDHEIFGHLREPTELCAMVGFHDKAQMVT